MEAAFRSGLASASLEVVLDKLATLALKEIDLIWGVDDDLKKLERTLFRIQALIQNAENKQMSDEKAWQIWLRDLKQVAYDADDLLDEISIELNLDQGIQTDNNQVRNLVLSSFKITMPNKISKIQKKLDEIAKEMDSLHIVELGRSRQFEMSDRSLPTSSFIDGSHVFGRDKDKEKIIELFMSVQSMKDVFVIPIIGMGGIGKTTLAQNVYNDEKVVGHFQLRMWVSVGKDFDVRKITKSIIESATEKSMKLSDLDALQVKLKKIFEGKRFLLIIDDLWNEKSNNWDVLIVPMRVGGAGSIIMVTTQSQIVSSIVGTTPAYSLQCLTDEDCWLLIKERALSNIAPNFTPNLEPIGKAIAKKCKGLPLVAKTLGSLLRLKTNEFEWDTILKSELWELPEDKNDIFAALRLSYYHLPSHLKQCFAYCSVFPQNYEFEKDKLVQLWMAEGFVQTKGRKRLEDVGDDYFDDLLCRSFFQYSRDVDNQTRYRMHDIIHNLAQLISGDLCFRMEDDDKQYKSCMSRNARHFSLVNENVQQGILNVFHRYENLRTFIVLSDIQQVPCDLFLKLKFLRVLDLGHTHISELPDSIDSLRHLRYLDLSETPVKKLPESIGSLYGLQTLKLKNCLELFQLPKGMRNLTNLRHLFFDIEHQLTFMPQGIGKLTNLQTLHAFIASRGFGCEIGDLKEMMNLRGSLCILKLENVKSIKEAERAKLNDKQYLDKLELQWSELGDERIEEEVLAGLQPHKSLKELQITRFGGFLFPGWLGDPSFSNLSSIYLHQCKNCVLLPSLGQLPLLKSLNIAEMDGLIYVNHEFFGNGVVQRFPTLETLAFHDMSNLKKWTELIDGDMNRLQRLVFSGCLELNTLPPLHYLKSLQHLEISCCCRLQALPEIGLPCSIQSLIIIECPILKERCKVEEGEDWWKIKTIPKIVIDFREVLVNNAARKKAKIVA